MKKIYSILEVLIHTHPILFTIVCVTVACVTVAYIIKKLGLQLLGCSSLLKSTKNLKKYILNTNFLINILASLIVVVFFGLVFKYNFSFINNIYIKLGFGLILCIICSYLKINMKNGIIGQDISKKRFTFKFYLLTIIMYFISIISNGYFIGFVAWAILMDNEIHYLSGPADDMEREIARARTPQIEPNTSRQRALNESRLKLQKVQEEVANEDSKINELAKEWHERKDRCLNYREYFKTLSESHPGYEAVKNHNKQLEDRFRSVDDRLRKEKNKKIDTLLDAKEESVSAEVNGNDDLTLETYWEFVRVENIKDKYDNDNEN